MFVYWGHFRIIKRQNLNCTKQLIRDRNKTLVIDVEVLSVNRSFFLIQL